MWTVLILLLGLLTATVLLLLAAALTPLRIEFRATAGDVFRYRLGVRPFGGFGPHLTVTDSEKPGKKTEADEKPQRGRLSVRGTKRRVRAGIQLLADIIEQIQIDRADVTLRFGTNDPAETGQIYGVLTPIIYGACASRFQQLTVEPVFDRPVLQGRAAIDITLTPARLLLPFIRFGWSAIGART